MRPHRLLVRFLLVAVGALALAFAYAAGYLSGHIGSGTSAAVVATFEQPESTTYGTGPGYTLFIAEALVSGVPSGAASSRPYELRVVSRRLKQEVRYANAYARGFTLHVPQAEAVAYLRSLKVTWESEGVQLIEPSGVVMFVPRKLFMLPADG